MSLPASCNLRGLRTISLPAKPTLKPQKKQYKFHLGDQMVQKLPRIMNLCKTRTKVPVARTLCTIVRARNVFLKRFRKNVYESRPGVKYATLETHKWFPLGFVTVLKASQNLSEKLKIANLNTQFRVWVGDHICFWNLHAKNIIIVQTFGVEFTKGRSSWWKTRSGEHTYAKLQREHDFKHLFSFRECGGWGWGL